MDTVWRRCARAENGRAIDLNVALEPEYLKAAAEVGRQLKLSEPIPKLCTQVTASAFDARGARRFRESSSPELLSHVRPEFMSYDLEHYLTPEFKASI